MAKAELTFVHAIKAVLTFIHMVKEVLMLAHMAKAVLTFVHMAKRVPIFSQVATVLTCMQIATALLRSTLSQQTRIAMLSSGCNVLSESCTSSKSSTETLLSQANVEVRRPAHKSKEIHKKRHSELSRLPEPHQTTDIEQTSSHQICEYINV